MSEQEVNTEGKGIVRTPPHIRALSRPIGREPNDLPLIVAHLLGGTNGFNFNTECSIEDIRTIVARAVRVAVEIQQQTKPEKTNAN